jgi:hypothetical protein
LIWEPSKASLAFFASDVVLVFVPDVPSTWVVRWPKAVKMLEALQAYLKISGDLSEKERFAFNTHKFIRNYWSSKGVDLVIYSENENNKYLYNAFDGNSPDNFNFDGCYRLQYVSEDGQSIATFGKNSLYLYGFNSDKTKSLWIDMNTGDIKIENIEENEDDED